MHSIQDILKLSTRFLEEKGVQEPRREAEIVLSDALKMKRMDLYLYFDRPLSEEELTCCREVLARRGNGEPSAHIRGEVEFAECSFFVSSDVLIPRPETEILVEKIKEELSDADLEGKTLLDLCSGSGCIGIALKKRFPQLKVVLSDLSEKALQIAKKNAERNGVEVEFLHGDFLAPFEGRKANFIVCNPPYLSSEEHLTLSREVKDFEPYSALVSGETGLEFYEALAADLPAYLHSGARIYLELGFKQGASLNALFSTSSWSSVLLEQDWAGHDRFLTASKS